MPANKLQRTRVGEVPTQFPYIYCSFLSSLTHEDDVADRRHPRRVQDLLQDLSSREVAL